MSGSPMPHLFPWFFSTGTNETVEAGNRPVDICCDGDLFCVKWKSSTQVSGIHVSFPSCTMAASQGGFPKPPSFLIPQFSLHLPSFYIAGRDWVSTSARSTWMHIAVSFYVFPFSCTGSFTAVCRLSRAEVSRGYTLVMVCRLLIGASAADHRLWSAWASVAVAHGLTCSVVRGIFLDQGSNPALAGRFLPTVQLGKPYCFNVTEISP